MSKIGEKNSSIYLQVNEVDEGMIQKMDEKHIPNYNTWKKKGGEKSQG